MLPQFIVAVSVCLMVAHASAAEPFKITFKRDTDRATITSDKDQTVIAIQSPFGISDATIERTAEDWPAKVVLRLSLTGLESFSVTNGETTLAAAIAGTDGNLRLWRADREDQPLTAKDSLWTAIRIFGPNGKPAPKPVKDGYFEIPLPKPLTEKNPKSLSVRWIDFYRN